MFPVQLPGKSRLMDSRGSRPLWSTQKFCNGWRCLCFAYLPVYPLIGNYSLQVPYGSLPKIILSCSFYIVLGIFYLPSEQYLVRDMEGRLLSNVGCTISTLLSRYNIMRMVFIVLESKYIFWLRFHNFQSISTERYVSCWIGLNGRLNTFNVKPNIPPNLFK